MSAPTSGSAAASQDELSVQQDSTVSGSQPTSEKPASSPVPLKEKLAWGTGGLAENLANNALGHFQSSVLQIGLGYHPALLALIQLVSRALDALTDPVMGTITDNTRSRFGRRRPWVVLGAVVMALSFACVWLVPAAPALDLPEVTGGGSFAWMDQVSVALGVQGGPFSFLMAAIVIYYIGFTIWVIPYSGLGAEMAVDYADRTRLQIFRLVPAFIGGLLPTGIYWLATQPSFDGDVVEGMRVLGPILAVVILVAGVTPALAKERFPGGTGDKLRLWPAIRQTLSNRSFLRLVTSFFGVFVGIFFSFPLVYYIGQFYIFGTHTEDFARVNFIASFATAGVSLLMMPIVGSLAKSVEKKTMLLTGLSVATLGYLSSWYLFSPDMPWLMIVPPAIQNAGLAVCWVVNGSFMADICDEDELVTGARREGMYSAVFSVFYKMAISVVGIFSAGLLMNAGVTGKVESLSAESLTSIRAGYAIFPSFCLVVAIVAMAHYPLSRRRVEEIQEELRARRDGAE